MISSSGSSVHVAVLGRASGCEARIDLAFDLRTPSVIDAVLRTGQTHVRAALLRSTLARGLRGRARSADLELWVTPLGRVPPQLLHLRWRADPTAGEWVVPLQTVWRCLRDTYVRVPRATEGESVDLDAELRYLLAHPN